MLLPRLAMLAREHWRSVFSQARTMHRALEYGLGLLLAVGRKTMTSSILARGLGAEDWSADYKMFSRSGWDEQALFRPAVVTFLASFPEGFIPIAMDDTKVRKTGTKIPHVSWQRDPLSPPFATNFIRAQRFLQASVLLPHHRDHELSARGIPVAFDHAPALKRPGSRATADERARYAAERKKQNLSTQSIAVMQRLREDFDREGGAHRQLLFVVDGSFCNRAVFRASLTRTDLIARTRKDAKLCLPAPEGSRRWYGQTTFTPEQVRTDESIPYQSITLRLGTKLHEVRFKEISGLLWRTGAARRPLRLFVIAPQPYQVRGQRRHYRQPAFLLTTDLISPAAVLIQAYIDRWQIEVNHREEKDLLGVGQAQVWSEQSVQRHPTFVVALYSMLLIAAFLEFGPTRTSDFLALPRWRTNADRPSLLDLLRLLRQQCSEVQNSVLPFPLPAQTLLLAANG
jgi:hypothetical protein